MKLKSFGCSFIYGSELPDTDRSRSLVWPSKKTWPARLANHLDIEYKSFARPAVGNLYIAEQILNECAADDPAVFVINWTYIDRFDYIAAGSDTDSWNTILPNNTDAVAAAYYRQLHSEYRDKLTSLSMMKLCIDTMLQHNIKFVMTYIDDLLFDQQWHMTPAVESLQHYIKLHCTQFDGVSFVQYAQNLGHSVTPSGHLLEAGHEACFDYARQNFLKDLI